jgi:mannose PTS system EIIA component
MRPHLRVKGNMMNTLQRPSPSRVRALTAADWLQRIAARPGPGPGWPGATLGVVVVAHAPLASALESVVRHVDSDMTPQLLAVDVAPGHEREASARALATQVSQRQWQQLVVLVDMLGASPWAVAQRMLALLNLPSRLVSGVNGPMLLALLSALQRAPAMNLEGAAQMALLQGRDGVCLAARDGCPVW